MILHHKVNKIFAKFTERMISLDQLLASRDARAAFQRELLEAHPSCTLLCLTVQLPGPEKRNALSLIIGKAGLEAIQDRFSALIAFSQVRDLETGFEAYYLVNVDALEAKRLCCQLEESHPLGRLMDLDVMSGPTPVSREDIGLPPRKCLLCNGPARWCMRSRSHTTEELLFRIEQMVADFSKNL